MLIARAPAEAQRGAAIRNREEAGRIVPVGRRYWWLVIVGVVSVIDLVGRFALNFDMAQVALFESVLFVGACAFVAVITTKYAPESRALRRVERGVAVAFGLASVRAMLWAAGARPVVANMAALVVGLMLAFVMIALRRRPASRGHIA